MKKKVISVMIVGMMSIALISCGTKSKNISDLGGTKEAVNENIEFEEQTVLDNEECQIKITGIDPDNEMGYALNTYLENKSADKTYLFSVTSAAIDGVQINPFFSTEVSSENKANTEIILSNDDLQENGLTKYTDIELTFSVFDNDDWEADSIAEKTVHIYPFGEEDASTFERKALDSDNVIVDNEYMTVTVVGTEEDEELGYSLKLFLENKTDKTINFSASEVAVNGYMIDPIWMEEVMPEKCLFSSMTWYGDDLKSNDISKVEKITFVLTGDDYDMWGDTSLVNEKVELSL